MYLSFRVAACNFEIGKFLPGTGLHNFFSIQVIQENDE
jgi:hypothetical protein